MFQYHPEPCTKTFCYIAGVNMCCYWLICGHMAKAKSKCPPAGNTRKFKEWFSLVPPRCVHCARFDILSSFFSETKCKTAKKNTGECFTTKLKSTCKNSGTFEEKKISPEKVTYVSLAPSHSIIEAVIIVAVSLVITVMTKMWTKLSKKARVTKIGVILSL